MIDDKSFFEETSYLNYDENWELSKYASSKIDSVDGRQIIIHILDIWDKVNENAKPIWLDLVERAGFYPYYVDKIKKENADISIQAKMRTHFFKGELSS